MGLLLCSLKQTHPQWARRGSEHITHTHHITVRGNCAVCCSLTVHVPVIPLALHRPIGEDLEVMSAIHAVQPSQPPVVPQRRAAVPGLILHYKRLFIRHPAQGKPPLCGRQGGFAVEPRFSLLQQAAGSVPCSGQVSACSCTDSSVRAPASRPPPPPSGTECDQSTASMMSKTTPDTIKKRRRRSPPGSYQITSCLDRTEIKDSCSLTVNPDFVEVMVLNLCFPGVDVKLFCITQWGRLADALLSSKPARVSFYKHALWPIKAFFFF